MSEKFPRSAELPSQSPLFWVEQKDRYLRQLLIRDIQDQTKRRLVVYFANRYERAEIDSRDSALMAEALGDLNGEPVDLLLETIGGQTDATEALISLVQSTVKDLRVVVANAAKSNGTLLCLASKCIVLGATSELGPIEPSVQGIPCSVLEQPQVAAQNFALHMAGKYALQQTRTLAKTLLETGMMKDKTAEEIADTVDLLASRKKYHSHGSVISHREAKAIGLAVEYLPPDDLLWQRLWLLYSMYDFDCRKSRYLKVFEGQARSTAIAAPPQPAAP